jgi:hypothetical protein
MEIQEQIVKRLEDRLAVLKVSGVEIIPEDRKDLESSIRTAVEKIKGLCVVVQEIDGKVSKPNLPGPVFDDMALSILVHEYPLINRSKSDLTSKKLAKLICKALHHEKIEAGILLAKGYFYQQDSVYLTYSADFSISR